ncbi:MAG: protein kinase [Nannocystaceae bacterium]
MRRLPSGTVIAHRFRIDSWVGDGGMGTIYRAHDLQEGDAVAFKVLHEAGSAADARRFAREAQILAELSDPAIVRHVAHGRIGDGPMYLAMEWLAGEDLSARLRRGPLSLADALALVRRVSAALALAHARGVVHRDIKPSNLVVVGGELEALKVVDFGIARRVVESSSLTRTGVALGTPHYMAPEQVRGASTVGPACDVFALGVVLYEALSGRPPFVGEGVAEVFTQILFADPPPLATVAPGVPAGLAQLCDDMLAKEPGDRPADGAALLARLADLIAEEPTARPVTHAEVATPVLEQQLCTVLYAASIGAGLDEAIDADRTTAPEGGLSELQRALVGLGAHVERLIDGAWIITMPSAADAVDQALLGARVAMMIRGQGLGLSLALATGKASITRRRAIGEAVERALHLLGERPAGSSGIWLDPLTARLLGRHFVIEPEASGLHRLVGELGEADEERALLGKATPCVGRDSELGILELLYRAAVNESEARAVVITGAPGSGKSRLARELVRRLKTGEEPPQVIEGRSEWLLAGAPHAILGSALRRLCGARRGPREADARARFVARIAADVDAAEAPRVVEFLAEIAGLPEETPSPLLRAARADPKIMREQVRRAFLDWLAGAAANAPVLLILEDLQWGDALTIALIDEALRALREAPVLVLALARPELHDHFPALWREHAVHELCLGPLSRRAAQRLVHHVLGALDVERRDRMIAAAAGNALYLEELMRAHVEAGDDTTPVTVLAMMQARLSRLGADERQILGVASVFAAAFAETAAQALVAGLAPARVSQWLDQLIALDFLEATPTSAGGRALRFRHELMREAIYGLLLPADQLALHRAVGLLLADDGAEPLMVAEHLARGGEPALAARWLLAAAQAAIESDDLTGARGLCERALAAVEDDAVRAGLLALRAGVAYWESRYGECVRDTEAALGGLVVGTAPYYRAIGQAIVAAARVGDADAQRRLQAAAEAPAAGDAVIDRFIALTRCAFQWLLAGERERAEAMVTSLEEHVPYAINDSAARAHYEHLLGIRAAVRGDMFRYARHLEVVIAAFERIGDLRNAAVERTTLAASLGQIGEVERGISLCAANLEECRRQGSHQALMFTRMTLGGLLVARRETLAEGRALLAEVAAEYAAIAYTRRLGILHIYEALGALLGGDDREAAALAGAAVDALADAPSFQGSALAVQALALVRDGRRSAAAAALARGAALPTSGLTVRPFVRDLAAIELALAEGRAADAHRRACAAQQTIDALLTGAAAPDARDVFATIPEVARILEIAASPPPAAD